MTSTSTIVTDHRPPLWLRLSIVAGNAVQLGGLAVGVGLLICATDDALSVVGRVMCMIVGWCIIYDCCHAIAHWAVGRLVGIRFRGYGIRGTDKPEAYPPGVRQIVSAVPMFVALTEQRSMAAASPMAKALMFAAGETSTSVCSVLAAWFVWQRGTPGAALLLMIAIIWAVAATIATAVLPKGDYVKAWRALRQP